MPSCIWCAAPLRASKQAPRFCAPSCRVAFHSALRKYGRAMFDAGLVSAETLKAPRKPCTPAPVAGIQRGAERVMEERPFSAAELGKRWGCSAAHIRGLVHGGQLACFRLGRLIRIPASAVYEYERVGCGLNSTGGRWYAVWTENGKTARTALRTDDRATAERRLIDLRRQMAAPRVSVEDIYKSYLKEKAPGLASCDRIPIAWERLKPHFAFLRPDQITRNSCRQYAESRKRAGVKDGTVLKELSTLRAILRWQDPRTPAVFEMPAAAPPRDRHLSRAEYRRLLGACKAPHIELFVVLAVATAGRTAALLELTWDRVDFKRGLINLGGRKQGKKGRATVPMTGTAREALEAALKAARTDFVIEYADRPVKQIRKAFTSACQRAGIEGASPHTLRHTAAVWLAESGVPMSEISAYLGHRDSRVTERVYAKYGPEYLRKAASALEG